MDISTSSRHRSRKDGTGSNAAAGVPGQLRGPKGALLNMLTEYYNQVANITTGRRGDQVTVISSKAADHIN